MELCVSTSWNCASKLESRCAKKNHSSETVGNGQIQGAPFDAVKLWLVVLAKHVVNGTRCPTSNYVAVSLPGGQTHMGQHIEFNVQSGDFVGVLIVTQNIHALHYANLSCQYA